MSHYIIAPDSFKGCLSSSRVSEAIAEGIRFVSPNSKITSMPLSDGGEGMLDVMSSLLDMQRVSCATFDPLMRRIDAEYAVKDDMAVIESARVCGIQLLTTEELNPMVATTYGLGVIVADAINRGCKRIVVGLGGSATCDAGVGMLKAVNDKFSKDGYFDDNVFKRLEDVHFTILADVTNPLLGDNGAAHVFAPQKGATPQQVEHLEWRIGKFAAMSAKHFGYDYSDKPSAGAAGGLGYAFMQYYGAEVLSGADYILTLYNYEDKISDADVVFTGEGSADRQTLMGKLPYVVKQHSTDIPVHLLCGKVMDDKALFDAGFASVTAVSPKDKSLEEQLNPDSTYLNIVECVKRILSL